MKNNKGFTLIELLAVVVILITIIVIITPKVFKQLKTAENVTDKEQINAIINATQLYMNQNTNLLPEQNEMNIISLNELKESGLIKSSQILNPSTKKELTGCIVVKYEKNKYKYEYKEENDCNNVITVTFDPQGGQLDQTTKNVIPNETYGELPTPTREGYTFMGWNGKNLLNIDKMTNDALINNNDGTYTIWYKSTGRYGEYFDVDIPENTKLIMNYELLEYNGTYPAPLQIVGTGDGNAFYISNKNSVKNVNINISKIRIYQEGTQPIGTYTKFKNLQLEEGDTATPYEPYYITSDTTVVQSSNHTLKAIWQAN